MPTGERISLRTLHRRLTRMDVIVYHPWSWFLHDAFHDIRQTDRCQHRRQDQSPIVLVDEPKMDEGYDQYRKLVYERIRYGLEEYIHYSWSIQTDVLQLQQDVDTGPHRRMVMHHT